MELARVGTSTVLDGAMPCGSPTLQKVKRQAQDAWS